MRNRCGVYVGVGGTIRGLGGLFQSYGHGGILGLRDG